MEEGQNPEAGTGYFKKQLTGNKIDPQDGKYICKLTLWPSPHGEGNSSPELGRCLLAIFLKILIRSQLLQLHLKLLKKLFVEKNTDRGPGFRSGK